MHRSMLKTSLCISFLVAGFLVNMSSTAQIPISQLVRSMKIDPEGVFMLGTDGVLRSFDENHMVLDAVGLSPEQIKEMLDQHPWDQEIEDKYRGVDGTNVVDMKQLYEPDEDSRPKELTEEEMRQAEEEIRVHNEKLMQQMEQDEKDGVDVAEKYRSKSNY